jgi:hypothetical protein
MDTNFAVVDIFESMSQLYLEKLKTDAENIRRAFPRPRDLTPGNPKHEMATKGHILKIYFCPLHLLIKSLSNCLKYNLLKPSGFCAYHLV